MADPEASLELRSLLRQQRPDVIHTHDWLARSVVRHAARNGIPVVATLHDYAEVCAQKRLVHRGTPCSGPGPVKCIACAGDYYGPVKGSVTAIGNWIAAARRRRAIGLFLPVSQAVARGNALARRGLPFRVIPNFVPDDFRARADREHPALAALPTSEFILFAGDVAPDKGAHVLLAAYERLDDAPPLVLIGRRHIAPRRMPRGATMLGELPATAVAAAWERSMFGVVPSIVPDSCPTVVLEAMAAGRPVVATRTGGIPDLVDDGTTGLLVRPGETRGLTAAMTRLLESPRLRADMSAAALRRGGLFTASEVVPRIEDAYRDAIRGNARL